MLLPDELCFAIYGPPVLYEAERAQPRQQGAWEALKPQRGCRWHTEVYQVQGSASTNDLHLLVFLLEEVVLTVTSFWERCANILPFCFCESDGDCRSTVSLVLVLDNPTSSSRRKLCVSQMKDDDNVLLGGQSWKPTDGRCRITKAQNPQKFCFTTGDLILQEKYLHYKVSWSSKGFGNGVCPCSLTAGRRSNLIPVSGKQQPSEEGLCRGRAVLLLSGEDVGTEADVIGMAEGAAGAAVPGSPDTQGCVPTPKSQPRGPWQ
ncbi:uncharacterized protein LOC120323006 [Pipra filicauda]|uniref:Uncharacterized protein LOC120323006 n=1 Tax=Pipra filicauda TaxID=649802 RepID=A0A7R5K7B3_9PASS|nr:uncharacterized protein LOC120323006 [Pipra filicauda]